MKGLMGALLCVLAVALTASAVPLSPLTSDTDLNAATVTVDWTEYFADQEGWYGVAYTATQNSADTIEVFCDLAASAETRTRTRIYFVDTDGTSALLKLLVCTDASRDSLGTALTEFKLNEFNSGTISSAFYLNPTGANGTAIYAVSIPQSVWFTLPDFGFNSDYGIYLVAADTTQYVVEHFWSEAE